MRKLISLFLALMLTVQPITVFASENSNNSDVLLIVTPQIFSAIVPTQLPVWMSADGVIFVAEDTMISNMSMGPIRIDMIELTNVKSDWELVSFNDDFNGFKVGSKKLAMLFNGDKSLASGNIPLGTINLAPIDGLGSMPLNYDAKIPAQNMGLVDEIPANVVFTLKWYEVGSASIEENNPNAYEFVPADTKILTINFKGVTADDDSVTWSSSNEAVATVADYVSRGRARPIDGSKQCIVTAVGSGNAIITGTLKDGTTNSFEVVVSNKDVASLEITKAPDKVNYIEGENFSSAGMVVTANYNNGTSSNISDYAVTDGTNLVISQESVVISYGDKTITHAITVVEKSLTSIAITTPPTKTSYVEGNSFDVNGMIVTAYYDNGTNRIVAPTLSRNTNLFFGQTSIDVSFNGKMVTQSITVDSKSIANVVVTNPPTKISYLEGNSFDATGMVVTAYYNNGTTAIVIPTLGRNTNLFVGQTSVDVGFDGITVTQDITVSVKTLTNIAITSPPTQTSYIEANNFDSTGMIVTATYNNGTTGIVTPTFARNTNLATGQTSIDVNFDGKTVTQDITVSAKTLISISITTPPNKKAYIEGNNFDATGMVVMATYNNGTTTIVTPSFSRNDNLIVVQSSIDVSFGGKTVAQTITVAAKTLTSINITTPPNKKAYIEGNNFDSTDMVVTAIYNNGTTTIVAPIFGRNDNLIVGQTSIDVSFGEKTVVQAITVVAKTLTNIAITTPPTKTNYAHWDNFDMTGMVVTASYNNGTTEAITNYTVPDGDNLGGGKTSVTINYNNKTTTQAVVVNNIAVGVKHSDGNYEYSYGQEWVFNDVNIAGSWRTVANQSGWGVKVIDNTQTNYSSPLTMIQGYPVTNMNYLFSQSPVTTLTFTNWDTSNVTMMKSMFEKSNATTINGLDTFDTSNVADMSFMFNECPAILLNVSSFDTSNVTNMERMFRNAQATSLDLSGFDTSNVTDMSLMFVSNNATSLDLSSFNTSNVTSMYAMFNNSTATSINGLASFDTSNVTNMERMFYGSKATSLNLSGFNTSNVTNMHSMFRDSQATNLDLSSFDTSKIVSMKNMFYNSQATSLNVSSFNTSNVTDMSYMFFESKATSLDLSRFNTSKVTTMYHMFAHSQAIILNLGNFNTSNVADMSFMFYGLKAINLDLRSFNTSNVTNMNAMFYLTKATSLDLSSFDTSKVTDMSGMFRSSQATTLDLRSFNTSKVTNMRIMFYESQATSIDLSNWNLSLINNSSGYDILSTLGINNVQNLKTLSLNNWIAPNITDMTQMFYNTPMTTLSLNGFNASNVTNMTNMFAQSQATILDLKSFNTPKVTITTQMFWGSQATNLDLSGFNAMNITNMDNMFNSSKVKNITAKTQADANRYKTSGNFPSGITITIKT